MSFNLNNKVNNLTTLVESIIPSSGVIVCNDFTATTGAITTLSSSTISSNNLSSGNVNATQTYIISSGTGISVISGNISITLTTPNASKFTIGQTLIISGTSNALFNGLNPTISSLTLPNILIVSNPSSIPDGQFGGGGTVKSGTVSTVDLTATNIIGNASSATNLKGGLGGSIPYQSAVNTTALLANGTAGQVLTSAGGTSAPTWSTPAGGASIVDTNTSATFYPVFVSGSGPQTLYSDITTTPFSMNPNTGDIALSTTLKIDTNKTALGLNAGLTAQGDFTTAIGSNAGKFSQGLNSISIGKDAGIGTSLGVAFQGANSVAIGTEAGKLTQGIKNVAIGHHSGRTTQATGAVAIGDEAGFSLQGTSTVAIGQYAGRDGQGAQSVGIGINAGNTSQGSNSIAIGYNCAYSGQGANSIALGFSAGNVGQGANSIALGQNSGKTSQGSGNVAIGFNAGVKAQLAGSIAIGMSAGQGLGSAPNCQGANAIAIGNEAGLGAGATNQGAGSVAVGQGSAHDGQGADCVAIGIRAGYSLQGDNAIAIGRNSAFGGVKQATNAIAIGNEACQEGQRTEAIAIGYQAGYGGTSAQGANAVAIGALAGRSVAVANSIILNGSGADLPASVAGFFVNPVRNVSQTNALFYNTATKEITYATPATTSKAWLTTTNGGGSNRVSNVGEELFASYGPTGGGTGCLVVLASSGLTNTGTNGWNSVSGAFYAPNAGQWQYSITLYMVPVQNTAELQIRHFNSVGTVLATRCIYIKDGTGNTEEFMNTTSFFNMATGDYFQCRVITNFVTLFYDTERFTSLQVREL